MVNIKEEKIARDEQKGNNTEEMRVGEVGVVSLRREKGMREGCCRRTSTRVNVRTNAPRIGFGVVSMETNSLSPGKLASPSRLSWKIALRSNSKKFQLPIRRVYST